MNKKLVIGITSPKSIVLIKGQLKWFREQGYDTYLMSPSDNKVEEYCLKEGCVHLLIDIERNISITKDFKSLLSIYKILKKIKPDIVNFGTPKVSLLGLVSAKLLGVKRRIYTCRGLRYEHEIGAKKRILILMEKITSWCAQDVICISQSVRELGLRDGLFSPQKSFVINKGSSNGFDLTDFTRANVEEHNARHLKENLNLDGKFVFGFVGRLVDRKGIKELYEAFDKIYRNNDNVRLLLVGPAEIEQITDSLLVDKVMKHPAIIMAGYQKDIPLYMTLMDVFILPSWWEGFGNVVVQAAAMGVAVISTTGTGTKDAVCDGYNGILVPPKDIDQLYYAMMYLMENPEKRKGLGRNGILWAHNFSNEIIWRGMDDLYRGKRR